jgi:hypothetical protein
MGKLLSRTLSTSKLSVRTRQQLYLKSYMMFTASKKDTGTFVSVLRRHPQFAVRLIDAIVTPLTPHLREMIGRTMLETYGVDSEGYAMDTAGRLLMKVRRIDNGQLDDAHSLPMAIVPDLKIRVNPSARRRKKKRRKKENRDAVIGFEDGALFGIGLVRRLAAHCRLLTQPLTACYSRHVDRSWLCF